MLTQFLSLFKPHTRMSDPNAVLNAQALTYILDPNLNTNVELFLLLYMNWASKNPRERMERFEVKKITLHKMVESTEHEFLRIETRDKQSGKTRFYLLDRTASKQSSTTTPGVDLLADPCADPPADLPPNGRMVIFFERLKKFASSIGALLSSGSLLTPMEEESSSSSSSSQITPGVSQETANDDSLSISDKLSLSITHTADLLSDSLNLSEIFPAHDRFLGESYVNSPNRQGLIIGHLIPTDLTLFDLAVLAFVAHTSYPSYSYLKEQCYFFAELIFASVKNIWKTESALSSERGRYGGFLVQWVDPKGDIKKVVEGYYNDRSKFVEKLMEGLHNEEDEGGSVGMDNE